MGRICSSCALQVQKVTIKSGEGFLTKRSSMCIIFLLIHSLLCHVATLSRNVATFQRRNVATFQRRDVSTSRRVNVVMSIFPSLSHRDMDLQRRDVNFKCLCHVTTLISNVATSIFILSVTSRRGFPTSRREFL